MKAIQELMRESTEMFAKQIQPVEDIDRRDPREKQRVENERSLARQRQRRERNAQKNDNTGNRPIIDNGVDRVPRKDFVPLGSAFNGTVAICVDGKPYWMNIIFDGNRGTYDVTQDRDFDNPTEPA